MSGPAPRRSLESPIKRRIAQVGAPGAIVAGLVVTGLALATLPSPTSATSASVAAGTSAAPQPSSTPITSTAVRADALELTKAKRQDRTNRSAQRSEIPALSAVKPDLDLTVTGSRYTTTALKVRAAANLDAKVVGTLQAGAKIKITNTRKGQWQLIVRDGKGSWVRKQYLDTKKPEPKKVAAAGGSAGGGVSSAACKSGNAMESGLTPDAILVHRTLCARYPQVSAFGGVRQGDFGEHGSGRAVDAMISDSTVGWAMAKWVRANAKALGVSEVIYSQQIWTVQRSGEGWRSMSDRGSATANHYDHVHVTVYGNSAG